MTSINIILLLHMKHAQVMKIKRRNFHGEAIVSASRETFTMYC